MLDYSSLTRLSNLCKEEFIGQLLDITISVNEYSTEFKIVKDTETHLEKLQEAFDYFSQLTEEKKLSSSGVEWFLDNYFAVQEACELIQDDLPEDYFRKLPSIKGKRSIPRIYIIAKELVAYHEIDILNHDLHEFLNAYQKTAPLRMGELWALPLMLRLVLIEELAGTIFGLTEEIETEFSYETIPFSDLDSDDVVARTLKTLLRFDRLNWKALFESHSYVDKILEKDPAQVYRNMDFETRDHYRNKVEKLAENSPYDEIHIARIAVDLAENHTGHHEKFNHVGFFLIDEGEKELKLKINYEEDFSEKFATLFYKKNTIFYLSGIGFVTALVVLGLIFVSSLFLKEGWQVLLLGVLSLIPASSVAVNLVNSLLTAVLHPQTLPKMDYREGIPKKFRTAVCIPVLLSSEDDIKFVLRQLELHYLANPDKNLGFILLSDFSDAPKETMPEDEIYLQSAIDGINQLNKRYRSDRGRRPFYLFHRRRQWNEKEDSWMGWERKRGKLSDFNRYLIEGYKDSFDTVIGEEEFLNKVRFVITVDSDTVLPRDSASSLIATLAHPLNRAEFDEIKGSVRRGYTILQPRTEVKPTSVNKSLFTQVFAGDLGLDLYTRAVSDVYQDLFGEGIYVGKGIYDVVAFQRSIEGKAPDNALLSHDLFEGLLGRAALVSDVVFFEEYPPDYASQVERLHRWVRGDWQLFPWLFPKVPKRKGGYTSNPFKGIDLWKIFDNLRRSLREISTFLALVMGWLIFNNGVWIWTFILLFISAFPLINNIVTSFSSRFLLGARTNLISNIRSAFSRWIFWLAFLPYESSIMFDAIVTTLVRVFISQKRLLQWQTSAHTIRLFGKQRKIAAIWRRMIGAPIITILLAIFIWLLNRNAFLICLPLLIMWLLSPQIAFWISTPLKIQKEPLTESERIKFRLVARRTWLFFERFIGPEDHWLPPDHFQEDPKGMVAHRTSPTNIGLMLMSTASAYDFGYIGIFDFIYRMAYSFETIDGLEKYRGHLFNWYDTRSLNTLSPRYISTVDSGNYAMSLIGLYQSLQDLNKESICPNALFQGIYDSLMVFIEIVRSMDIDDFGKYVRPLNAYGCALKAEISQEDWSDSQIVEIIDHFQERLIEPMNQLIERILSSEKPIDTNSLEDTRYWSASIFKHVQNIQRQIYLLAPWIQTWKNRPEFLDDQDNNQLHEVFSLWYQDQSLNAQLSGLPDLCRKTIQALENFLVPDGLQIIGDTNEKENQILLDWLERFIHDLDESNTQAEDLFQRIEELISHIDFYLERMEFDFLFDHNREVFYLGYQVDSGKLDNNHYDLLASEARTASLYAIAQNQVPRSHWLHMSRPFTEVSGSPTLVSWNGSMFEYIMPNLFTRTYPETLLFQTSQSVIQSQMSYAKRNNVPWGISESSYYRFDQSDNYQYRGFGVPGLGRKRGLADDLVIAPYASLMAVSVQPRAVLKNLDFLKREGALGHCGFYESIDYTPARLPRNSDMAVIKSYMAHHQGMIFIALANLLNPTTMVDRIHQDPRIRSTELLLQEQIPQPQLIKETKEVQIVGHSSSVKGISIAPWSVQVKQPGKSVHVLTNGKLMLLMTESGSGYLEWEEIALTRWRQDSTMDQWGIWFYVQDLDNHQLWSIGSQPINTESREYNVFFAPHMTEIRHVKNDINFILQTTISPNDDICFHKIAISNQSDRERELRLLSYGEVVLAPQASDQNHPAFNKMFIESSFLEELNMLFFKRRKRSSEEKNLGMAHLFYDKSSDQVEYETDRTKFIGRNHNLDNALALLNAEELSGTVGTTLDPIFSIAKRIKIKHKQSLTLTYMTVAAENETMAKGIASKYRNQTRIDSAFEAAQSNSEKVLRSMDLNSQTISQYQELLSHVIYPIPSLRSAPEILENNSLGQPGLWSFGISGDYPILLVMIERKDQLKDLHDALLAHSYWRKSGMMIDLVILNTKDTGYAQELNDNIYHAINVLNSQNWVNRRGGIFVQVASQIDEKKLILLRTAAHAVIDLSSGNIEYYLRKAKTIDPHLPPLTPTEPDFDYAIDETVGRPENLVLDNGIGGFAQNGKEYQIYMRDYPKSIKELGQTTPATWINVISNQNFGF